MAKKIQQLQDLVFDEKNINKGSEYGAQLLEKSLKELGAGRSVLADKNGILIAGNKTVKKCEELGINKVKVVETTGDELVVVQRLDLDINSPEGAKMKILDNTVSKHNYVEDLEVAEVVCEEVGIEPLELGLEIKNTQLQASEDNYEIPEEIETDIVPGDLFEIGPHRLLCGDSTNAEHVAKLMNGEKADITVHSPPYNVGRTPNGNKQKYQNDSDNKSAIEYLQLLERSTKNAVLNSIFSFVNVQSVAGNKITLIEYLADMKEWFCDYIIWDKMQAEPAMCDNVLNSRFEFVYVFGESATRRIGVKKFRGNLENIIFIKSRQDKEFSKFHKATFPIAFAAYFIENFSVQSCLDLFCGTGTTMVAAHQLKRKCYGMEISPQYCQIIINRMRNLDPSLEIKRNGKPYGQT
jgi:DNA modification methylase